jgi:hypothetical protein
VIASGNNLQFGKTALNKLELAVGWTEKFQLVDIRKDDFFLCQALIAFLISLRNECFYASKVDGFLYQWE